MHPNSCLCDLSHNDEGGGGGADDGDGDADADAGADADGDLQFPIVMVIAHVPGPPKYTPGMACGVRL